MLFNLYSHRRWINAIIISIVTFVQVQISTRTQINKFRAHLIFANVTISTFRRTLNIKFRDFVEICSRKSMFAILMFSNVSHQKEDAGLTCLNKMLKMVEMKYFMDIGWVSIHKRRSKVGLRGPCFHYLTHFRRKK